MDISNICFMSGVYRRWKISMRPLVTNLCLAVISMSNCYRYFWCLTIKNVTGLSSQICSTYNLPSYLVFKCSCLTPPLHLHTCRWTSHLSSTAQLYKVAKSYHLALASVNYRSKMKCYWSFQFWLTKYGSLLDEVDQMLCPDEVRFLFTSHHLILTKLGWKYTRRTISRILSLPHFSLS